MAKLYSSEEVAYILSRIGIFLKRRSKEDVFEGVYKERVRTVVVPRNKKEIPQGTLSSIWRQAGLEKKEADQLFGKEEQ